MKKKEICPASGNCQKQFLKGEVTCKTCKRRKRDMEPRNPVKTPEPGAGARNQEPDELEGPDEPMATVTDAFGNEAEHLWWVPMEFVHEFEKGLKQRFTFKLLVAGRDEEDARDNAECVTIDDIVDDNPDFDGLDSVEIRDTLYENGSVCEIDWEDLPEDDTSDCPLHVDNESDVEIED